MNAKRYSPTPWLVASGAIAAIAATVTLVARDHPEVGTTLAGWATQATWIPTRHWARHSSYPVLAGVYFLCVWPIALTTAGATTAALCFPVVIKFGADFTLGKRAKGVVALLFFGSAAVAGLAFWDGSDYRGIRFGTSLADLLAFGWFFFAAAGVTFTVSLVGLYVCIVHDPKARG
ncbi:hypothetical protein [Luteibacter yeojuensis]|uniref:Uncharacterized protein n=1 Tax=Luteibacter yeojuensis TaxID=345309 RepID=A0A0F3KIF4_9GAMM|nr:hypothetical protein [Luteibacter yeojuensis]KJV30936.1 hypothetical protein VI08_14415 [Luteibacter yeojuensis]